MNDKFELPDLKENEENVNNENNQNILKEKIEIPQEYYDKLEKEKEERLAKQAEIEKQEEATKGSGSTFFLIIINALLIFALLFAMVNYNHYIIFVIPIYVVLATIISCNAKKKDSSFNVSILVGGMVSAIISFLITMINKDLADTYIYYAFASFVVAFAGYILSTIITKIMTDKENVKALQTIVFLLFIAAMIGLPYYLYSTKKDDFMRIVFQVSESEVAKTQEEFIVGTLKDRYKKDVECLDDVAKHVNKLNGYRYSNRTCEIDGKKFVVISTIYNESKNEYIVKDSYLDNLFINDVKDTLTSKIMSVSEASQVKISLYPENKCYFIGECESNENYEKEMDLDNLFKYSKELKLDSYLGLTKEEFINNYKFRIHVSIKGDYGGYSEDTLKDIVDKTLNILNEAKYKNTMGYEVEIRDAKSYSTIYRGIGKTNSDKTFSNPNYETID